MSNTYHTKCSDCSEKGCSDRKHRQKNAETAGFEKLAKMSIKEIDAMTEGY